MRVTLRRFPLFSIFCLALMGLDNHTVFASENGDEQLTIEKTKAAISPASKEGKRQEKTTPLNSSLYDSGSSSNSSSMISSTALSSISSKKSSLFTHTPKITIYNRHYKPIYHESVKVSQQDEELPEYVFDKYLMRLGSEWCSEEPTYLGTIVFFHGGPSGSAPYGVIKELIESCLEQYGDRSINYYRFVNVEIAGSKLVREKLDDYLLDKEPNYVTQIAFIMDQLKDSQFKEKPFIALAHSFGGYQLLNYLRFKKDRNDFHRVVISGGVFNIGSWSFQRMVVRNTEKEKKGATNKDNWECCGHAQGLGITLRGHRNEDAEAMLFHPAIYNHGFNQKVSPFFHVKDLPNHITYLLHTGAHDRQVHGSQSISLYKQMVKAGLSSRLVIDKTGPHNCMFDQYGDNSWSFGMPYKKISRIASEMKEYFDNQELGYKSFNKILVRFIAGGHLQEQKQKMKNLIVSNGDYDSYLTSNIRSTPFFEPFMDYHGFEDNYDAGNFKKESKHSYRDWNDMHTKLKNPCKFFLEKTFSEYCIFLDSCFEEKYFDPEKLKWVITKHIFGDAGNETDKKNLIKLIASYDYDEGDRRIGASS